LYMFLMTSNGMTIKQCEIKLKIPVFLRITIFL